MSRVCTTVGWTLTAAFIVGSWLAYFGDLDNLSRVLGLTGCAMSAVAATLNVRCYANRITRLIRLANGLAPGQPERRRPLRSVAD